MSLHEKANEPERSRPAGWPFGHEREEEIIRFISDWLDDVWPGKPLAWVQRVLEKDGVDVAESTLRRGVNRISKHRGRE